MPDELPEGWQTFTAALPPNLYAKLQARAEAEGVDVLTEAAYLLSYALDNAPSPSFDDPPVEEMRDRNSILRTISRVQAENALLVRMRMGALAVGDAQKEKT